VLIEQISAELRVAEEQAREEARQAGYTVGYEAAYPIGRAVGYGEGWNLSVGQGCLEAQQRTEGLAFAEKTQDSPDQEQSGASTFDEGDTTTPAATKASVH
jgi:hypothetical protein